MNRRTATFLPFLGIALLVGFLAIRPDSFWIDEANSAVKATQPDLGCFAAKMKADRGSDLQMPGYMLALWSWEKIFGCSEKALRGLNVLFFAFAMGIVAVGMKGPTSSKWFFLVLACTSAYVWAYLSEARPYALEFFGATCIAVSWNNLRFFAHTKTSAGDWMLATWGLLVLFASSLSTVFFVGGFGLAFLWLFWSQPQIRFSWKAPLPAFCLALFLLSGVSLCVYYIWSIQLGAKASAVGQTDLLSLLFSFYEMAGAQGLGPSRQSLRENAFAALAGYWPQLGLYFFVFALWIRVLWEGSFKTSPQNVVFSPLLLMTLLAVGALLITGMVVPFRLTGRHWMPIFPFVLLWASNRACKAWQTRPEATVVTCAVLIILSFISCLALRFSPRHAKDDYRAAARFIQDNRLAGETVWWAADDSGARFYGLKDYRQMANANRTDLSIAPPPAWVILSKADVYDGHGSLREYLAARGGRSEAVFQSFVIYRLPVATSP